MLHCKVLLIINVLIELNKIKYKNCIAIFQIVELLYLFYSSEVGNVFYTFNYIICLNSCQPAWNFS